MSRRTFTLLFAGAGALTGTLLGVALFAAPAFMAAADDTLRDVKNKALAAVIRAPSAAAKDYNTLVRKLHPDIQKKLYDRRKLIAEAEKAMAEGRAPCKHDCSSAASHFCAVKAGVCMIKPQCRRSETLDALQAVVEGKRPLPPTPRAVKWIPANYTGTRPPLHPSARKLVWQVAGAHGGIPGRSA